MLLARHWAAAATTLICLSPAPLLAQDPPTLAETTRRDGTQPLGLVGDPAPAGPVLTLPEAIARARGDQPAIAAFEREAEASEEAAIAARSLPDPQVSAGIQNFPLTDDNAFSLTDDFMTMYTIGVMREQVRRSRRDAQAAQLRAEAAVSRAQGAAEERLIERQVMLAWIRAVEAGSKQKLLDRIISDLRVGRAVIEAGIPTGRSNPALALAAQAEISLAQARLASVQGAEARARGELSRWIGSAATRPLPDDVPVLAVPEQAHRLDPAQHPQILATEAQGMAAQRQADVARTDRRSDLSWSVMLGLRPKFGHMISAQVSIPLQINRRGLQDRKVAEAEARAGAARLRSQDAHRELQADTLTAIAEYRSASAAVSELQGNAIPALEASFEAAEARYSGGQGTLELPLDVVRRYVEANLELVEQKAARARAAAELLYLVGDVAP